MKLLSSVFLLAAFTFHLQASIQTSQKKFQRSAGTWTQKLSAFSQQDNTGLPAQYFMCGFQQSHKQFRFAQTKCQKTPLWGFQICKLSRRTFIWRTNGLTAVFCSSINWKDQKTVNFNTNDSNKPGFGPMTMCPQGTYAQGFRPGFGLQNNVDMGFNGLQLKCQPLSQANSTIVSRSLTQQYQHEMVSGNQGSFISALQIKYIARGMLTGIKFIFQAVPQISKIDFIYNLNNLNFIPERISRFQIDNEATQMTHKQYKMNQKLRTQQIYSVVDSYKKGFRISKNVLLSFPSSVSKKTQNYEQTVSSFSFGSKFVSTWSNRQTLNFIFPGKTKIIGQYIMYYQKIDIPYTAQVTFVNINMGQFIGKSQFEGTVYGDYVQKIIMKISQQPLSKNLVRI